MKRIRYYRILLALLAVVLLAGCGLTTSPAAVADNPQAIVEEESGKDNSKIIHDKDREDHDGDRDGSDKRKDRDRDDHDDEDDRDHDDYDDRDDDDRSSNKHKDRDSDDYDDQDDDRDHNDKRDDYDDRDDDHDGTDKRKDGDSDDRDDDIQFGLHDVLLDEDGSYTTKSDVANYLRTYGHLPQNFITKKEAKALGWDGGSLERYAPGKCIGGDRFGNHEGLLPEDDDYHECDIDTLGAKSRGAKRLVYSDDGDIYYTEDHYKSFTLIWKD